MATEFTRDDVAKWLGELTRTTLHSEETTFEFELKSGDETQVLTIEFAGLDDPLKLLGSLERGGETELLAERSYEVPVREESPRPFFRQRTLPPFQDLITCEDADNGITYELSVISDEYLLFLLSQLSDLGLLRGFHRMPPGYATRRMREMGEPTILNLAKHSLRLYSLKIRSASPTSPARFRSLANSYCFQVSYNVDAALVPIRLLDDVSRRVRILRVRRAKPDEIDPPRRIYEEDLVRYYLQGVSAESPLMQYLSYYHVAEHFFESIYQDAVVQRVRDKLTQPGFSYNRKRDIRALVKLIRPRGQVLFFDVLRARMIHG